MGAAHSASEEVRELEGKTGFSSDQIEQLHRRFKQLSGDQPTIRKENFNNVPDLELNPIRSKIVRAFFDNRNLRKGSSGLADEINFEDFLTIMSYFRPIDTTLGEEQGDVGCIGKEGPCLEEPDQVYEGITFEDFLKIWQGIDIETKMHIRFLNMETIALCH